MEQPPNLEFTAVDPLAENLREAEALFLEHSKGVKSIEKLQTVRAGIENIERVISGAYDIIVLSNMLNEVAYNEEDRVSRRVSLLKTLMNKLLIDDGSCIVIEPALKETSRELMEVRDGLLMEGFCIYSPCLISEKCPALANPKDWCHQDISWDAPDIVRKVDRLTGLRKDSLKFSYLVIRKDGLSITDIYGTGSFRVVSDPLATKGKTEYYICGTGGRLLIVLLDKDRAPINDSFNDLLRGDIVCFDGLVDEGKRLRVTKGTVVLIRNGKGRKPR